MKRRTVILILGAMLSMGAAPLIARAAVEPLVQQAAGFLGGLARSVPKRADPPPTRHPQLPPDAEPAEPDAVREPEQPTPERRAPRKASTRPKPSGGILVRRNVVRAAVKRGIRPSATPVAASGDRPAGLAVYGWGAAGAGLADGDIITRVGGRTPTSVDDVVIAVAGAYKTEAHVVSGQIWRSGRILAVTVELPLPERRAQKPRPASSAHRSASRSTGGP